MCRKPGPRLPKALIGLAVALFAWTGTGECAPQAGGMSAGLPEGVTIDQPNFNWGTVKAGALVEHQYKLINRSDQEVRIEKVKPG